MRLLHPAVLLLFVALLLVPSRAWAEPPNGVIGAIVAVDAYEHTLGAVVGDGRDVLVPFAAIAVERPGEPDASVIDRNDTRFPATLIATDRASGLALLRVGAPLTETPFAVSAHTLRDEAGLFLFRGVTQGMKTSGGAVPALLPVWRTCFPTSARSFVEDQRDVDVGAPVLDEAGDLVAMSFGGRLRDVAPGLARMRAPGQTPQRRPWIFYAGGGVLFDFHPKSEGDRPGVGFYLSFAVRWRDLLETRLDGDMAFIQSYSGDNPACSPNSDSCLSATRLSLTPSIGARLRLGGFGTFGPREFPIAVTPSMGVALGLYTTTSEIQPNITTTSALAAPGLAVSVGPLELRMRLRLPRGDATVTAGEVGVGVVW